MRIPFFCFVLLTGFLDVLSEKCLVREYGPDRKVCVCNKAHCDTIDPLEKILKGQFVKYTSNKNGLRFEKETGDFVNTNKKQNKIFINSEEFFQKIVGFGGALTDATGINLMSLDEDVRNKLMMSYFSEKGVQYSLVRVTIAASDFSSHPYTYHDKEDKTLSNFSLVEEDYKFKLPIIHWIRNLTNNNILFYATAWAAPLWMKSNGQYNNGPLKEDMYQVWADYHVKFLDAYEKEGVTFWAISNGNEPFTGFVPFNKIPSVAWTSRNLKTWFRDNFAPSIRNSSHSDIKLFTIDDSKLVVAAYIDEVLSDEKARNYSDGVAFHYYMGGLAPPNLMTQIHKKYPEQILLGTEASEGSVTLQPVHLGDWERAEDYAYDIIHDMNNFFSGWIDWNMALDLQGGPTYIGNFCDAPIIVNVTGQEFLKQPMFYAIGHFSKFVPKDSQKIFVSEVSNDVFTTGFKRPDGGIVVVILNRRFNTFEAIIEDKFRGDIVLNLSANSLTTVVYW